MLILKRLSWTLILLALVVSTAVQAGTIRVVPGTDSYQVHAIADVLEDATGKLGVADVSTDEAAAFKQAGAGISSFGFTSSAYWLRFDIDNPSADERNMILVLRSAWLDTVSLYQPNGTGGFAERHLGDTLPFSQREYAHPQFLLNLRIPPGKQTYYLRLTTDQAFMTPIELWEPEAFHHSDRLWAGYFGVFYGVVLVMVLYNGFIWLSTRDRSYLYFCLYLVTFFITNFSYSGFSFQYFWPESPRWANWSYPAWIFLYQVMVIRFTMVFLETRSRQPRTHRLLQVLMLVMIGVELLSLASGRESFYNAAPIYFVFLYTPIVVVVGAVAWLSGYRAARFFVMASMGNLVGAFITALTVSGLLSYSFIHFHAVEFGVMADVVLLALALADRLNFLHEQTEAAEKEVLAQKQRANMLLEKAKEDLERTVIERTAELAKARDEAEKLARIDGLTGVFNRRYFEETAAREVARVQRNQQPLSVVLFDIDLFKQINDSYGHAAGDEVIRGVAQVATETVREVDFVARIGGEEFAILLPGIAVEQALVTAERLRERVADELIDYQGQKLAITASFGVAQLGEGDQSHEPMLRHADEAMYRSKNAGRNQVSS